MPNYKRPRDAAPNELGDRIEGSTLQLACVNGDFAAELLRRLNPKAQLDVIDVLPVQLANLRAKLGDATSVCADAR